MNFYSLMTQGGAVSQIVAVLLLSMSVASWVVILWKAWLLQRATGDVALMAPGSLPNDGKVIEDARSYK